KPTIGIGTETTDADALGDPLPAAKKNVAHTQAPKPAVHRVVVDDGDDTTALSDLASLSQQPNQVKATKRPTTAPVAQSVAGTSPAPQPDEVAAVTPPPVPAPKPRTSKSRTATPPPAATTSMPEIHAA